MKTFAFVIGLLLSAQSFASGAVDYTCVGYSPNPTKWAPQGQEAVVFNFTSAPSAGPGNTAYAQILSRSESSVDPKNSALNLDSKDCTCTSLPSKEHSAYNVTIKGTCGTKVDQDITGICFFN